MAESISPQLLKVLTDVTGEIKLKNAMRVVVQEAIAHRLEHFATQLQALEQKYGTTFAQFDARFQRGEIPCQHRYEVEQDFKVLDFKKHLPKPKLCAGDGPIGKFREYAESYYA